MAEKLPKDLLWHSTLIGSNKDLISNKTASGYDPNKFDQNGLSALHWAVLQMMIDPPKTIGKNRYANIELAIKSGVDPNTQCTSTGFTALCMAFLGEIKQSVDIPSLEHFNKVLKWNESEKPRYDVILKISQILAQNGATLKPNNHNFSPLSYSQLYFHERPEHQLAILNDFACDINVVELAKLAFLKAVTPQMDNRLVYTTTVKHGIPFQHDPFTKISLSFIVSVLMEIHRYFGFDKFEIPYNLPTYHCQDPITCYNLELISAICYFIKVAYKGEWMKMVNSDKNYHRIVLGKAEKAFVILASFIAIHGSHLAGDDTQFYMVERLSEKLQTYTVLHKIIASRDKWKEVDSSGKETEYIARYLAEINLELWDKVVMLMNSQVNNRCRGSGLTALHYAGEYQDFEMVHFLIEKLGAYPYAVCYGGNYYYDLTFHEKEASKRTDQQDIFFLYEENIRSQVRSLMTQCANAIIKYKINYICLVKDRQLFKFICLHSPGPVTTAMFGLRK